MNDIAIGIMCFGDDHYYQGAQEKLENIRVNSGIPCYILTDDFDKIKFTSPNDYHRSLRYNREFKSYYDKMMLVKEILKHHNICILIDADTHITDYSFLHNLKKHNFKPGISYPDVLLNHPEKKEYVIELDLDSLEWRGYDEYARSLYPEYGDFELIWEYFMVFNKEGFNQKEFYRHYEKLQIVKEFYGLPLKKEVNGAGEGVSISISSKLSDTMCQRDHVLYDIIKDKMVNVSRKHTRKENWPKWME